MVIGRLGACAVSALRRIWGCAMTRIRQPYTDSQPYTKKKWQSFIHYLILACLEHKEYSWNIFDTLYIDIHIIINSSNHCNTLQKMYISTIFLFAKDQYSSKNVHIWTLFLFVKESLLPLIVGHNHFLYIPGLQIEAIHYFSCIL